MDFVLSFTELVTLFTEDFFRYIITTTIIIVV